MLSHIAELLSTLHAYCAMPALMLAGAVCGMACARTAAAYGGLLASGQSPDEATLMRALRAGWSPGISASMRKPAAVRPRAACVTGSGRNSQRANLSCSVLMACVVAALYFKCGWSGYLLALCMASSILLLLALIDTTTGLLPDALTLPLVWLGVGTAWLGYGPALQDAVAGAMCGYIVPWLVFQLHRAVRRVRGMGYGDFKLAAALGGWLGWQAIAPLLLGACLLAIMLAMWREKSLRPTGSYAFGPFMVISAVGVFIAGADVHLWLY